MISWLNILRIWNGYSHPPLLRYNDDRVIKYQENYWIVIFPSPAAADEELIQRSPLETLSLTTVRGTWLQTKCPYWNSSKSHPRRRNLIQVNDNSIYAFERNNPFAAEIIFVQCTKKQIIMKIIRTKSCGLGTHMKALAKHSQMSTHSPGFQSFFRFFASFCIGKISHQQHKG